MTKRENIDGLVAAFIEAGGQVKIGRTRKAKGIRSHATLFGGNRVFLAARPVASAEQGGMLRMGTGLRKYGN